MRVFFILAICAFAIPIQAVAAPTFTQKLEGIAAECSLDGWRANNDAVDIGEKLGKESGKYKEAIASSLRVAGDCVDLGKLSGKQIYRTELIASPNLKPAIADFYAAWIGYMDWIRTPRELSEDSIESIHYRLSVNKLAAEMDAQ